MLEIRFRRHQLGGLQHLLLGVAEVIPLRRRAVLEVGVEVFRGRLQHTLPHLQQTVSVVRAKNTRGILKSRCNVRAAVQPGSRLLLLFRRGVMRRQVLLHDADPGSGVGDGVGSGAGRRHEKNGAVVGCF